jgi:signal transduction histidine kinase
MFFVVTILLPCALIAVMAARMLVQDRELVATRVADARRRLVVEARQELLARIERLRSSDSPGSPIASRNLAPEVALVAPFEGITVVLPWEDPQVQDGARRSLSQPRFREAISRGEREEFAAGNPRAAASIYTDIAHTAVEPEQRATAGLLAARAFTKAARPGDAHNAMQATLGMSPTLIDDQGIPFVAYAARMLATSGSTVDTATITATLQQALSSRTLSPAAIYMIQDAAGAIAANGLTDALAARTRDVEQILALRTALPTLGLSKAADDLDPTWIGFGPPDNTWLVSIRSRAEAKTLIAVRAASLIESVQAALPVTISVSAGGDSLAPTFPGLRAVVSPVALSAVATENSRQRPFYLGALTMVVSVAIFGAVLFWRDVRRDIRVAELRSQFVSSVSHELKTPLTAIRMFSETLLMGRTPPEVQQEYLETIVNESERLTRLLNNVLDFSSIESGNKIYRLEPQSPASIVRAAAKAMEYPFAQQGFELRMTIEEDLPAIAADADAIQQAVLNLLSNAVKYSGDGRIIDLDVKRIDQDIVIAVTDRGVGIAAAEQSRIFEKYYRVRESATARVPGTGLGLTLVDHVVRGHGGRVIVNSVSGKGSTFALAIPVAASSGSPIAASEVPA